MNTAELKKGWITSYVNWMYDHDLNFQRIADKCGLKYGVVYRMLNGYIAHPHADVIEKLSEVAGDDWNRIAYGE